MRIHTSVKNHNASHQMNIKELSMNLGEFVKLIAVCLQNSYIPPDQARKVLLLDRFLTTLLTPGDIFFGDIKYLFVYEGSTPETCVLQDVAKDLGILTFQYTYWPVLPYEILYNIKSDFLLRPNFSHPKTEVFNVVKDLSKSLAYIKLKDPGINRNNFNANNCGIVLDMFDFNDVEKKKEISSVIQHCETDQKLKVTLKFHPQILKRPRYVIEHHMKNLGINHNKSVYCEKEKDFLSTVSFIITNSESMIIQDAIMMGTPVIFFSKSKSIYVNEIIDLCPQLICHCGDFLKLDNAIRIYTKMTIKNRRKAQKAFLYHRKYSDVRYPQLTEILSD